MEKGGKADTNYESVNMDMSDESDNEMFSCKNEYKAFKQQFSSKPKKTEPVSEYGGDDIDEQRTAAGDSVNEYGSGPATIRQSDQRCVEYGGGGGDEYGGGVAANSLSSSASSNYARPAVGRGGGGGAAIGDSRIRPSFGQDPARPPSPTPPKIERKPQLYKDDTDKDKKSGSRSKSRERNRSRERSSKSKESGRRTRSRSKGRKRSHSKGRGEKDKRRSRSRSREKGREFKRGQFRTRNDRDYDARERNNWGRSRGDWRRDNRRGGGFRREEHRRNVEEQLKKVEEMGVEMPKYYKAGAINPVSYAEQVQKRKMLWKKPGADEDEETKTAVAAKVDNIPEPSTSKTSFNKWEATNFGDDKANEKFRRLMGIKSASRPEEFEDEEAPGKDSHKIMNDLEKNYEVARQQTHRNRGIGLGFSNMELGQPGSGYGVPPGYGGGGGPANHSAPYGHGPALGPASMGRAPHSINFVKKQ